MKLEYNLPANRVTAKATVALPDLEVSPRPPRVTCLLALAHQLEELIRSDKVKDYAEIAQLGHISRARVSQILNLLALAPSIQEQILWKKPSGPTITERELRKVVREPLWSRQRSVFDQLVTSKSIKKTTNASAKGPRLSR